MKEKGDEIGNKTNQEISEKVTDKDLLQFGGKIIFGIGIIFIIMVLISVFTNNCNIINSSEKILPPIVTLILGGYFASNKK